MMYLVYEAPPSDVAWGLVRDTRESIIGECPWPDGDEAALYYYLLDLEENWPGRSSREPGEPDVIHWSGHRDAAVGLPERPSDIPDARRHVGSATMPDRHDDTPRVVDEPRRYRNP